MRVVACFILLLISNDSLGSPGKLCGKSAMAEATQMSFINIRKIILIFFLAIFASTEMIGQAPSIGWQKSYGGSLDDRAFKIIQCLNTNYIVIGYTNSSDGDISFNHGFSDIWVMEIDTSGNIQWQKSYGGSNGDVGYSIIQTADSGFIIAGATGSADGDVSGNHDTTGIGGFYTADFWIIKISSNGSIQWQKCFGGTEDDIAYSIIQTADGGFIIGGDSYSDDGDVTGHHSLPGIEPDYWIVKTDSNGNLQWQKSIGSSGTENVSCIIAANNGQYMIAGSSYPYIGVDGDLIGTGYHGFGDAFVVNLDSLGNIQWKKSFGGAAGDGAKYIIQTADQNYILVGTTLSNDGDITGNHGSYDIWALKFDNNGVIQWQGCYGGSLGEAGNYINRANDNNLILVGEATSDDGDVSGGHWPTQPSSDYWVFEIDSLGTLKWQKCLGGSCSDVSTSSILSDDGNLFVIGYSASNDGDVTFLHDTCSCPGWYCGDIWVVKLGPASSGVSEVHPSFDFDVALSDNLQINFKSSYKAGISVHLFDSRGMTLLLEAITIPSGVSSFRKNIGDLSKGIYFIGISDKDGMVTRKLIKN